MKQLLLSLVFLFSIAWASAESSLQILDHNNKNVTGKTITISSNVDAEILLSLQLKVKNTGSNNLDVFVARIRNLEPLGSDNSFCFGVNCYPPFIDTSQIVTPIVAGATDTSFVGDYYPYGNLGVSSVTYIFYDNTTSGTTVSASVTVNYSVSSLKLFDATGNCINGSAVEVLSTDTSSAAVLSTIVKIQNNSGQNLEMFVHRITNSAVPGTLNSFCYGICYQPETDTSFVSVFIHNGTVDSGFVADYYPDKHGGTTSLTYEFFDNSIFGIPLVADFTINFILRGVGMPDLEGLTFNGPYPNPAGANAFIDYSFAKPVNNSYLSVRNILGSEVERVMMNSESGKAMLLTSDLANGIYSCSLVIDGKNMLSRKLIVSH
ncbi:MAG: hypothetical protein HXX13_10335 [Bacteroidetes bacterium]|nr:hypothetical protein [Bacteroidota bacterium]